MKYTRAKILSNKKIVDGIYEMVVAEDSIVKPGQFYMLKHQGGTLLPRPISISESKDGKVTFVYATVGKGTKEFASLTENDYIELTGPLGNGFDVDKKYGNVALVSGGIGIAPMVMLARELRKNNVFILSSIIFIFVLHYSILHFFAFLPVHHVSEFIFGIFWLTLAIKILKNNHIIYMVLFFLLATLLKLSDNIFVLHFMLPFIVSVIFLRIFSFTLFRISITSSSLLLSSLMFAFAIS